MKHQSLLMLLLLALCACGAAEDTDSLELGHDEQASTFTMTAQCGGSAPQYGVDLCDPAGGGYEERRCDRNNTNACCFFPTQKLAFETQLDPTSAWTTQQKSILNALGVFAAAAFDSQFTAWSTPTLHMKFSQNGFTSGQIHFVSIRKRSFQNDGGGTYRAADAEAKMSDFVHMNCTTRTQLVESYSMLQAQSCSFWTVDIDVDKLDAWFALSPSVLVSAEYDHILRNILARAIGLGTQQTSASHNDSVTDDTIQRGTTASQHWQTGETSWPNNFMAPNINIPNAVQLNCVP